MEKINYKKFLQIKLDSILAKKDLDFENDESDDKTGNVSNKNDDNLKINFA